MQCFDIRKFSPKGSDKFLLDTNILLFLYSEIYEISENSRLISYQDFMDKINFKNVYITPLNLSEYENVLKRRKFNEVIDNYRSFKEFRESKEFSEFYKEIILYFELFTPFNLINIKFSKEIFNEYLDLAKNYMKRGQVSFDFNDYLIAKTAEDLDLYLVTDDKDFIYFHNTLKKLKILTSNDKLLNLCKIYV